jgi:hypothetical protein
MRVWPETRSSARNSPRSARPLKASRGKERYQTKVESWRGPQSQNIEFTMKRLRKPIEDGA